MEYFAELELHRNSPRHNSGTGPVDWLEQAVQQVIRRHARGDRMVARELSHFVPRFFSRPAAEILATPVTEEEARLMLAVAEIRAALVEYLLARGADLDRVWKWQGENSVRSFARFMVRHTHDPDNERVRRILELCGAGTIQEILAEKEARRPSPPRPDQRATRVMRLAPTTTPARDRQW